MIRTRPVPPAVVPRSSTKRRPSGAKAIPVGSERPLAIRVFVKPEGSVCERFSAGSSSHPDGGPELQSTNATADRTAKARRFKFISRSLSRDGNPISQGGLRKERSRGQWQI